MATDRSLPRRIAAARDDVEDVAVDVRAFALEVADMKPPSGWLGKSRKAHQRALRTAATHAADAASNLRLVSSGLDAYHEAIVERIRAEDRAAEAAARRREAQRQAEEYAREHGNPFLPGWG